MARNYSSNNSGGGGCLLWIIGILLLCGNIALFDGSFDEMPLLCVLAIIADIFIVGAIIKAIADRPSKSNTSQTSSNQPISQQPSTRSVPPSVPKTTPVVNEDNSKLNQLKSKYRVPNIPSVATAIDPLQKEMESYQCIEVLQNVNKAISRRRACAKKMKSIKDEIDGILACPGCGTDRERLKFIKNNEDALQQKKNEYAAISAEIKKVKVVLLSKEKTAFNRLFTALAEITSSEKAESGSGVALSSFVKLRSNIPGDLFASEQAPIELDYGAYKFFLLPDVVLAYDKANSFVTAFEPMALIITVRDQKKNIYMRKNSGSAWSYTDSVIARDSALVSEGYTRTSWLHERKSGGPDLRYSYNPRYESRTDTYAHSVFSIQIGQYKAEYSISKANLSNKLRPMVKDYCSVMHELNAAPSLLRLLESVSKKREAASLLSEKYESISKNIICKVS
jgi:hypothetical protein